MVAIRDIDGEFAESAKLKYREFYEYYINFCNEVPNELIFVMGS